MKPMKPKAGFLKIKKSIKIIKEKKRGDTKYQE